MTIGRDEFEATIGEVTRRFDEMSRRVRQLEAIEYDPWCLGHYDAVRAYHSVNQPIAAAPWTVLAFDSERFDTNTLHDLMVNNSRLTCQRDGIYQITAHFVTDFTDFQIWPQPMPTVAANILLNATWIISSFTYWMAFDTNPFYQSPYAYMSSTTLWEMSVGDYVEVWAHDFMGPGTFAYALPFYSPEFMMTRVAD